MSNTMQNLYSMDDSVQVSKGQSYIPPGVHENVELIEVKYGVSKNNNEFFAVTVKDDKGRTVTGTEWPTIFDRAKDTIRDGKVIRTKEENYINTVNDQKSRIKQILSVFLPEVPNYTVSSWKEFIQKAIELLGDSYKGKKVRIKSIYDYKGFVVLATKGIFIEPMSVGKADSKISDPTASEMNRPQANKEVLETNPLGVENTQIDTVPDNKISDEIPF